MQVFQHANPGITSRIGFTFHFPDYTPDELTEMFRLKMSKNGFVIDTGALTNVNTIMEYFSKMDDFGNGRFVDKVIDMTVNNRAKRAYARKYNDILGDDIPTVKDLINVTAGGHLLWTDEEQSDDMRKRIAIHEAGHALVSSIVCPERTIKEITINADAASMGKAVVESDYSNNTEKSLKGQLAILFGGRNAERLLLGDHSAGCMEDISRAKHLANYMIDQLAMGDFGVTTEIDLLKEADKTAMETLQKYKDKLEKLAKRLFDNGTIIGHEVTAFTSEN